MEIDKEVQKGVISPLLAATMTEHPPIPEEEKFYTASIGFFGETVEEYERMSKFQGDLWTGKYDYYEKGQRKKKSLKNNNHINFS